MKKLLLSINKIFFFLIMSIFFSVFTIHCFCSIEPGDIIWEQRFGGNGRDIVKSIIQTSDSGFAILANTSSYGAGSWDAWLIKLDSEGSLLWKKTYGGRKREAARDGCGEVSRSRIRENSEVSSRGAHQQSPPHSHEFDYELTKCAPSKLALRVLCLSDRTLGNHGWGGGNGCVRICPLQSVSSVASVVSCFLPPRTSSLRGSASCMS